MRTRTFDLVLAGQEVEDVVAEVAAVAGILGLSDRITQELVSLQPRRALAGPMSPRIMALLAAMRLSQRRWSCAAHVFVYHEEHVPPVKAYLWAPGGQPSPCKPCVRCSLQIALFYTTLWASHTELHCQTLTGRFLDAEGMVEVVKELRRLLPGAEPGQVLRNDPSWLLRCGRSCSPLPVQGITCADAVAVHVLHQWTLLAAHMRQQAHVC